MVDVSFSGVALVVAVVFGLGVILGMLLYRVLWHLDTASLRSEIVELKAQKNGLIEDVVRLSKELSELRQRLDYMETQEREMRADLRAAAKRERKGYGE